MKVQSSFMSDLKTEIQGLSNQQKWLYCLYAFLLIARVMDLFRAIENRIGLGLLSDFNNIFFISLATIGCFAIFRKKLCIWDFVFLISLGIYHQIGIILHPQTSQFAIENTDIFLWSCLPMYLVGRTIDSKTSITMFVGLSYVSLLLHILFFYILEVKENEYGEIEMMGASYGFLPFVCFLLWDAFERHKLKNYVPAIIAFFLLLSMGTRGPIVSVFCFIAFYIILFTSIKKRNKILICVVVATISYFSTEIALFLSLVSSSLGLSTRVFDAFQQSALINLKESNGRYELWSDTWNYIMSHNTFWGDGFYSDHLANVHNWYSHNLELELLCDFGVVGGSIIFMMFSILVFRAVRNNWNTNIAIIVLVFFCSSVVYLQFSSTFLQAPIIWFFLGMCLTLANNKNSSMNSCAYRWI